MSFTRCLILAVFGCSLALLGASRADDKPPAPDETIKAFVAHLGKNGIKLEAGEKSEWPVTDPKGDGYKVIVILKTFPASTTEKEMLAELSMSNLGYMLNATSRLAMSHPFLRGTEAGKPLPKLDQVPVVAKLEKLFKEYPPKEEPKETPK
jgi:hypothetical protein